MTISAVMRQDDVIKLRVFHFFNIGVQSFKFLWFIMDFRLIFLFLKDKNL